MVTWDSVDDLNGHGHPHVESLWADYQATGSHEYRQRLTLQYAPLVKYVAGRVGSLGAEMGANLQATTVALDALVGAIDEYAGGSGGYDGHGSFESLAIQRMASALEWDQTPTAPGSFDYEVPAW